MALTDWDKTAANNATAGSVNWSEGQNPNTVNDSARQMMADIALYMEYFGLAYSAGGTADALTLTTNWPLTAYATNQMFTIIATATNATTTPTLAVDGLITKTIKKLGGAALAAGDITSGDVFQVVYNGTDFIMITPTRGVVGNVIGTDVQAYSANLASINQNLGTTDSPTFAGLSLTKAGVLALAMLNSAAATGMDFKADADAARITAIAATPLGLGAGGVDDQLVLNVDGTITASGGGSLTGTWSDLGSVTTIDINGGTIDGTVIGGSVAAAGSFTTLNASGNATVGGLLNAGNTTIPRLFTTFGGSAAAPSISIDSDNTGGATGFFGSALNAAEYLAATVGGVEAWRTSADLSTAFSGRALFGDGTSSLPDISFANDLNTGFSRLASDEIAHIVGGLPKLYVGATGVSVVDKLTVEGDAVIGGSGSIAQFIHASGLSSTIVSGGSAFNLGANVLLRGEGHTTAAGDMEFRNDAVSWGIYDSSVATFTLAPKLIADGGAKISGQNKVDGGSGQGWFYYDTDNTNYGAYMAQAGALKSLADGTACAGISGRSGWHIRQRIGAAPSYGFIWENSLENCLAELTADTGDLYTKGAMVAGSDIVANQLIRRKVNTSFIQISGGTTTTDAANIIAYGGASGANPYDMAFRHGISNWGYFNYSAGTFTLTPHLILQSDLSVSGMVNLGTPTTLTCSSDTITVTKSNHRVSGAGAAADDLSTINGGGDGDIVALKCTSASMPITVKHGVGNIFLNGSADFVLASERDKLWLQYDGDLSEWHEFGRGDNG